MRGVLETKAIGDRRARDLLSGSDWGRLSPLPQVNVSRRAKGYSFEELAYRYREMDKEPLLVRGMLGTPYIPADPSGAIHLDGLLAAMVVDTHPVPPFFEHEACVVPLPVELAWVSPAGLPLWTSSDLRPQGDAIRSQEYWHKRYPEQHHDEVKPGKKPNPKAGRWKEMRIPLSAVRVPEVRGICVGNAEEVSRLLAEVTHVGKKPAMGYGRILEWRVASLEQDVETACEATLEARPVPLDYIMESEGQVTLVPGQSYSRMGWTSPYWYAPNHAQAVIRG